MQTRPAAEPTRSLAFALLAILAVVGWRYAALIAGLGSEIVDFETLHGDRLLTEAADTRLNAWILDWVSRSLMSAPLGILDTNGFHPARGTLTGSEHLVGIALPLLPLGTLLDGAVARHQLALVVSALGLGVTSLLAVRAWTGSTLAGLTAGVAAVLMPWRVTELSHLQLSSVQWFPLIWWLVLRSLLRPTSGAERALLGAAVALQLLSSFYLAYFLTISLAVWLAVAFGTAARRERLWPTLVTLLPGYALFGASALPYLQRRHAADLAPAYDPAFPVGLERTWTLVRPRLPGWLGSSGDGPLVADPVYALPAGVLALAVVSLLLWPRREPPAPGRPPGAGSRERRLATLGLAGTAAAGLLLALGGSLELPGVRVPLPSRLFAAILPGFEMLRGPVRWHVLVGTALPLLAGLGVAAVAERVARGNGRAPRAAAAGAALLALATLDGFRLPSKPVWQNADALHTRYAALAALPPGPVIEVPFTAPFRDPELGSRALLASTLHRRPVVNGYTGYAPPSHALLRRIAARLPSREAVVALGRLTGVRYFVVDHAALPARDATAWQQLALAGLLTPRFADASHRIYELRASSATGEGIAALRSDRPGPTTATGLPRTPLALAPGEIAFSASTAGRLDAGIDNPLAVTLVNRSRLAFAGLDVHREGLVGLRFSWWEPGASAPLETGMIPLDRDLAPGRRFEGTLPLPAPLRDGRFTLCVDAVQTQDGVPEALPVPPVVELLQLVRPPGIGDLHELIEAYSLPGRQPPPCVPPPAPAAP